MAEIDPEKKSFISSLRRACRKVYEDEFDLEPRVAAPFGDALAFYAVISGLNWDIARSLANSAYFFPNDVVRASDEKLLGIKGIGPKSVAQIRRVMRSPLPKQLSASEVLDKMLEEALAVPLPDQKDLLAIYN